MDGNHEINWYLSDKVPGGIVRYSVKSKYEQDNEDRTTKYTNNFVFEIMEIGQGAMPKLGSLDVPVSLSSDKK